MRHRLRQRCRKRILIGGGPAAAVDPLGIAAKTLSARGCVLPACARIILLLSIPQGIFNRLTLLGFTALGLFSGLAFLGLTLGGAAFFFLTRGLLCSLPALFFGPALFLNAAFFFCPTLFFRATFLLCLLGFLGTSCFFRSGLPLGFLALGCFCRAALFFFTGGLFGLTFFFLLSRLLPFFFGATGLFCGLTFGFFALRLRLGGPFAFGLLLCSLLLCLTLFFSLAGGLGGGCACSLFCGLLLCDPGVERLDQTIRAVPRSGGDIQR